MNTETGMNDGLMPRGNTPAGTLGWRCTYIAVITVKITITEPAKMNAENRLCSVFALNIKRNEDNPRCNFRGHIKREGEVTDSACNQRRMEPTFKGLDQF